MSDPLVSILIPTYNREAYLTKAVKSALDQSYSNIEILVLDDASSDGTPEIMHSLGGEPRLVYLRHPANLGIARNWRFGINRARGDFICILHDDDTFEPNFVENTVRPLLRHPEVALAFSDHWIMSPEGHRLLTASDRNTRCFRREALRGGLLDDLLRSSLVDFSLPIGATLLRRSAVEPEMIRDEAKGAIDYWLLYQIVRRVGTAAWYVPERLMNYRRHSGSMTRSRSLYMTEGHLFRLQAALDDPAVARIWPELRKQRERLLTAYGIGLLRQSRWQEARGVLGRSLHEGFSMRAAAALTLAAVGSLGSKLARRTETV